MEDTSRVAIVMVNYNGKNFQNETIRSIEKQTYKNYKVIIVDNASSDGSVELCKEEFPWVKIIELNRNTGVAYGNNVGIKYALKRNYDYVLLLNNDVEMQPDLIEILLKEASNTAIAVPKIYYFDKKKVIWSAGGFIDWDTGTPHHLGYNRIDGPAFNKKKEVECAPTCCMLIHRNIFQITGFMDPEYFLYYDDTDFCIRANDAGVKILYIPEAFMWHKVHSSTGGRNITKLSVYYLARNRLYLLRKNKSKLSRTTYFSIIKTIWESIFHYDEKKFSKYALIGFKDFLFGKMGYKKF